MVAVIVQIRMSLLSSDCANTSVIIEQSSGVYGLVGIASSTLVDTLLVSSSTACFIKHSSIVRRFMVTEIMS
jgi:hypothetical protein